MYVCLCACTYACRMYVYVHVCMYVCVCTCINIKLPARTNEYHLIYISVLYIETMLDKSSRGFLWPVGSSL